MSEKEITERVIKYERNLREFTPKTPIEVFLKEIAVNLFSINLRLYHFTELFKKRVGVTANE